MLLLLSDHKKEEDKTGLPFKEAPMWDAKVHGIRHKENHGLVEVVEVLRPTTPTSTSTSTPTSTPTPTQPTQVQHLLGILNFIKIKLQRTFIKQKENNNNK